MHMQIQNAVAEEWAAAAKKVSVDLERERRRREDQWKATMEAQRQAEKEADIKRRRMEWAWARGFQNTQKSAETLFLWRSLRTALIFSPSGTSLHALKRCH
jgi:hypothetical protein